MTAITSPISYLDYLQAKGRINFTTQELCEELKLTNTASIFALHRLRKKKLIASPVTGFHVIVTPEYRRHGCISPELFIDELMQYLETTYYVGLLSAADLYGAAHQKPQALQVMVERKRKNIRCGNVAIHFILRKNLAEIPQSRREVKTGWLHLSSPEATAFDLVGYYKQSAGLQNVLTVLSELAESIDPKKLAEIAPHSPVSWAQRLGLLFSLAGVDATSVELLQYVQTHAKKYVLLDPNGERASLNKNQQWKVHINESLEAD